MSEDRYNAGGGGDNGRSGLGGYDARFDRHSYDPYQTDFRKADPSGRSATHRGWQIDQFGQSGQYSLYNQYDQRSQYEPYEPYDPYAQYPPPREQYAPPHDPRRAQYPQYDENSRQRTYPTYSQSARQGARAPAPYAQGGRFVHSRDRSAGERGYSSAPGRRGDIGEAWAYEREADGDRPTQKGNALSALLLCIVFLITATVGVGAFYINSVLGKVDYSSSAGQPQDIDGIALTPEGRVSESDIMSNGEQAALAQELLATAYSSGELYRDEDVVNILLIGADSRRLSAREGRSESLTLLSINKSTKRIVLSSLQQSACVYIPGRTDPDRLDSVYAYGGAQLCVETLESSFGVDIDNYIVINSEACIGAVDALGGVTVELSRKEMNAVNEYTAAMNSLRGENSYDSYLYSYGDGILLDGRQALGYVRDRGGDWYSQDAKRREILLQAASKLKGSDIAAILRLLDCVAPNISTDMSRKELTELLFSAAGCLGGGAVMQSVPEQGEYPSVEIDAGRAIKIDTESCRSRLIQTIY